jgi:ligand-binding sensor domain-containing protein
MRRDRFLHCCLMIWLWLAASGCWGQYSAIVAVPNAPKGISTLIEDSESRLWMATKDDVYCFDGQQFYSLRQYGFPAEYPTVLAEDGEHGIWIATRIENADGVFRTAACMCIGMEEWSGSSRAE